MQITDQARDKLIQLLEAQNAEGIRIYFGGYGWGGPQFGVSLDEPQANDIKKVINQIQVAFDPDIEPFTNDLVLEYFEEYNGFQLLGASSC